MTSNEQEAPRGAWGNKYRSAIPIRLLSAIRRLISKTLLIVELEVRKVHHDPVDLFTRTVQPVLWLLIVAPVFNNLGRQAPAGYQDYRQFMAPGILAQSVLFIAIFYGVSVIMDRDVGIVQKLLVSPAPRLSLSLGKAISGGVRAIPQAAVIYVLALLVGVKINWNILDLLGVVTLVVIGAALFCAFSLVIAFLVKTRERFMGMGQVMTMPLFFASNAIYPVALMPNWLQVVARINPLSYEVDGLRAMMLAGAPPSGFGIGLDFLVLVPTLTVLVLIGAMLYPRIVT